MRQLYEIIRDKNQLLLVYSVVCIMGAIMCFTISRYSAVQVMGISAWIKPAKFFLSAALFTITMGVYLHYLDNQKQVSLYSWSIVVVFSLELLLIVYQAARGKMSHFNVATAFDRLVFNIMALAITILMLHTLYIAILFFSQNQFSAPEPIVLAVKLSILITILFAFEGFAMGAILKHTIGNNDGTPGIPVLNWSKNHGDLRVAHFFGIHAIQVIPLLTYLLAKSKRDVIVISIAYFLFVTYTLIQALQGKPLIKL
ncbi:hypothetical protein [Flavobacterium sp.]|uniref:hypothetical protein n=1 Tax=Flavobacterium sp. TaxID=239 RepID=UPI0026237BDB|nr:hypothetical protein [Flavobacterium sp.]